MEPAAIRCRCPEPDLVCDVRRRPTPNPSRRPSDRVVRTLCASAGQEWDASRRSHHRCRTRRTTWTDCASAPSWPRSTRPGRTRRWRSQRDLELVEHLDRLGYDEAWIGEHHSAGTEIIASPEIFIAAAAERTKHIKLGTGVTSIAYHNPLWVAERMVLLDHLTRGRAMLGCGPGSLPTDSMMLGLTPTDTRELLEVDLDIIMRLLRGETVTPANQDPHPRRRPAAPAALHRTVLRDRRSRGRLPRRARGWPAATASACCPSAPR